MFVVDDDPLVTGGRVGTGVLVDTPVAAPATQHAATARHAPRQLLDCGTVVEGEICCRDDDITEAQGQGDRDKLLPRGHSWHPVGVGGEAGDARVGDGGRTLSVMEVTGVRGVLF